MQTKATEIAGKSHSKQSETHLILSALFFRGNWIKWDYIDREWVGVIGCGIMLAFMTLQNQPQQLAISQRHCHYTPTACGMWHVACGVTHICLSSNCCQLLSPRFGHIRCRLGLSRCVQLLVFQHFALLFGSRRLFGFCWLRQVLIIFQSPTKWLNDLLNVRQLLIGHADYAIYDGDKC